MSEQWNLWEVDDSGETHWVFARNKKQAMLNAAEMAGCDLAELAENGAKATRLPDDHKVTIRYDDEPEFVPDGVFDIPNPKHLVTKTAAEWVASRGNNELLGSTCF